MVKLAAAVLAFACTCVSAASSQSSAKACPTRSIGTGSSSATRSRIQQSSASFSTGGAGTSLTVNTKNASGASSSKPTIGASSTGRGSSLGSTSRLATASSKISRVSSPSRSKASNAGCPTYTDLPTFTYTDTSYTWTWSNPTATVTSTWTTTEITVVLTTTTVIAEYGPNIVTSTFPASTRTTLVIAPAATTVTIPTNEGFTPLRCQSDYFQPTTTVTVPYTQTLAGDLATEVIYNSTTLGTSYSYTATTTSSVYATSTYESRVWPEVVTVATTRVEATSTVYEACATNNVTPDYPGGNYTGFFDFVPQNAFNGSTGQYYISVTSTLAADARDCCQLCQSLSNCTASAYQPFAPDENSYGFQNRPNCYLTTRTGATEEVCSLAEPGQRSYKPQSPVPDYYTSNGPCGRWEFPRNTYFSIPGLNGL